MTKKLVKIVTENGPEDFELVPHKLETNEVTGEYYGHGNLVYLLRPIEAEPDFMECDSCRVKPGSPLLCKSCAHNRNLIMELHAYHSKGKSDE